MFQESCVQSEGTIFNGNPLQCSCLENPRDRRAWWAAIYGVTQSRTRLKWLSSSNLGGGSSSVELKDIVMHNFLSRNQDPVWRVYHHLIVSPLFLYPLPSLISNCLNPPFGTQGRSRRLNEAYILQTRNGEHRTDLYSRAPQSPAQF